MIRLKIRLKSAIYFLFFQLFFFCTVNGQVDLLPAYKSELRGEGVAGNLTYFILDNRPFTGILIQDKTNKKLGEYLHGYKNGFFTEYFSNGKKFYEGNFKYGVKDGQHNEYYENGNKKMEVHFVEGKFTGSMKVWYNNGKKKSEGEYKDGIRFGLHSDWLETGQLTSQVNFNNNKKHGLNTTWYDNKNKKEECTYVENYRNGLCSEWYENGQLKFSFEYKYDKVADGTYTTFLENGDKEKELTFKNGNIIRDGVYKDGFLFTTVTEYYPGDKLKKSEGPLRNGKKHGEWTAWYENGEKKWNGIYLDNVQERIWTWYYDNGDVSTQEEYASGEVVRLVYTNPVEPKYSVKENLKPNAFLFRCLSEVEEDTAYLQVLVHFRDANHPAQQLILEALEYRFGPRIPEFDIRNHNKKKLKYTLEFSNFQTSTRYDDGISYSKIGFMEVKTQVSPGYRGVAKIHLKISNLIQNKLLLNEIISSESEIMKTIEQAKSVSTKPIITAIINSTYQVFKLKARIQEIVNADRNGIAKTVRINIGKNRNLVKGFVFNVFLQDDMYNAIGVIEITSSKDMEYSNTVCKVKGGEELISRYLKENRGLLVVSKY